MAVPPRLPRTPVTGEIGGRAVPSPPDADDTVVPTVATVSPATTRSGVSTLPPPVEVPGGVLPEPPEPPPEPTGGVVVVTTSTVVPGGTSTTTVGLAGVVTEVSSAVGLPLPEANVAAGAPLGPAGVPPVGAGDVGPEPGAPPVGPVEEPPGCFPWADCVGDFDDGPDPAAIPTTTSAAAATPLTAAMARYRVVSRSARLSSPEPVTTAKGAGATLGVVAVTVSG